MIEVGRRVITSPTILAEFEYLNSAEFWPLHRITIRNFGPGGFRISEPNQKHNCCVWRRLKIIKVMAKVEKTIVTPMWVKIKEMYEEGTNRSDKYGTKNLVKANSVLSF